MFQEAELLRNTASHEVPNTDGFQFDKLFPLLPSFWKGDNKPDVIRRVRELGKKGGRMDAHDPLVTVSNPLDANLNCHAPDPDYPCNPDNDNADMTVGFTFLGQFLDHDITLDRQPLTTVTPFPNERSPFFDLDSVYGLGPKGSPHLYDPAQPAKLLIELAAPHDLPRDANSEAIIAEGRNDENVIISQLHLAFLHFHNHVVDHVKSGDPNLPNEDLFKRAKRTVLWHYQYIIVHQYLRFSLDSSVYEEVKNNGPTIFKVAPKPGMPREFQVAAFRFGHTQIRPGYKINSIFGAPIFDPKLDARDDKDPSTPQEGDPNDLRGGRRAFRRFVEWNTFFDFGTKEIGIDANGQPVVQKKVKKNKRIDPFISSPMLQLPVGPGLPDANDDLRSLAGRNLERHIQHDIASGQDIATEMGYLPLDLQHTIILEDLGFHKRTPLWWYILKEALVQQKGERLGQVGSRIVAEVSFGLLLSDKNSYWATSRNWKPELPRRDGSVGNDFTMTDLLTFARVG